MKNIRIALGVLAAFLAVQAHAAVPAQRPTQATPPYSEAILAGDTLYVSGKGDQLP